MADASINIRTQAPTASIAPRAAGRQLIRLPSLVYTFSLRAECPDQYAPHSLSLSVADTQKSYSAAQITARQWQAIELHIPARQIAPLTVENFCSIGGDGSDAEVRDGGAEMTVHDVLSAQVSLTCANESAQTMIYASKALDVILACQAAADN